VRFWAWSQHPLDRARVEPHSKAGLDALGQIPEAGHRLVQTHLLQKAQDLRAHLVPTARTWSLRHQRRQATSLQRRLGCVEHRAREAKAGRGVRDGVPVDLHPPQHLVFDLHQVARIEEGVATKKWDR